MDQQRIITLANYLECSQREQEQHGFEVFCIGSEDKISHAEAKEIIAALRARSSEQKVGK